MPFCLHRSRYSPTVRSTFYLSLAAVVDIAGHLILHFNPAEVPFPVVWNTGVSGHNITPYTTLIQTPMIKFIRLGWERNLHHQPWHWTISLPIRYNRHGLLVTLCEPDKGMFTNRAFLCNVRLRRALRLPGGVEGINLCRRTTKLRTDAHIYVPVPIKFVPQFRCFVTTKSFIRWISCSNVLTPDIYFRW